MNLDNILKDLREEQAVLAQVIINLEILRSKKGKRRGRPPKLLLTLLNSKNEAIDPLVKKQA